MGFTMAERQKIRAEYAGRYRKAKKAEKTKILDEYLKLLGKGNRKYAILTLNREGKKQLRLIDGSYVNVKITGAPRRKREYQKYYDGEVAAAVIKVWRFFWYICGERLVPLLRTNLDAIGADERFGISAEVKRKLATISRATVERLLTGERKKQRREHDQERRDVKKPDTGTCVLGVGRKTAGFLRNRHGFPRRRG